MRKKKAAKKKAAKKKAAKKKAEPGLFKKWKEALQTPELVEELELDVKQLPRVTWPQAKPLPPEIGKLENLRVLEIRARNLEGLCDELGTLEKLESLSIDNSEFELELGSVLAQLPALRHLELYNVGLRSYVPLPKSLETLVLQANDRLDVADWCEQLADLPQLRSLSLNNACPGPLPASIANLPSLRSLDLGDNGYEAVPESVFKLTKLEKLNLSSNRLATLPPELSALRSLTDLTVYGNAITALPDELRSLSALQSLWIGSNPLRELPRWIDEWKALRNLDASAAPLSDLPPTIAELPLERLCVDVPAPVLAELKRRLPGCDITARTAVDEQREVQGWLRFLGKD